MNRKYIGSALMGLSTISLILSLVGIGAAWYYNRPLTEQALARIDEIDTELESAESALQEAEGELERALRLVDSAEEALQALSEQTAVAKEVVDTVGEALDETILPSLETSKEKINLVQASLQELRETVEQLNRIPFVDLEVPGDETLAYMIEVTETLEAEVDRVDALVAKASTLISDASYVLGADLQETRRGIQNLLDVIEEYGGRLNDWRAQLGSLEQSFPVWIDRASLAITLFLLWFGFSQVGLILHGITLWHGGDPLNILPKRSNNS